MYRFINPKGEVIKTKTVKEFALQYGFAPSHARDLACGYLKKLNGWCSTHPKAKKQRERFLTVLVNPRQGKREILGRSIAHFARDHGLCMNELWKLINGRKICYRGWMLEITHQLAQGGLGIFDF
jgi:hypothetical protein